MIITIDGPCASGKSSVARVLAKKLGFHYLQTGLFYRAAAYVALARHPEVNRHDFKQVAELFTQLSHDDLAAIEVIEYRCNEQEVEVWCGGLDITGFLHEVSIGQAASVISVQKIVRDRLLRAQRDVAGRHDIVADGRDCGSIVFPHAHHKFYLTARVDVRAVRLLHDPERKAQDMTLAQAIADIEQRDERDMNRAVAPLVIPNGATIIDSSDLTFDQTVARFEHFLKA